MTKAMNLTRSAITVSIAIVSILFVNACSQKVDTTADKAALNDITKITMQAFNQGNIANYVALIAEDAVYMPPGVGALVGKEAIRDWYIKYVQPTYQFNFDIITESTEFHGQFAFQRNIWKGTYTNTKGDDPVLYNVISLDILRKQADGTWKIWRCMWNKNRKETDSGN